MLPVRVLYNLQTFKFAVVAIDDVLLFQAPMRAAPPPAPAPARAAPAPAPAPSAVSTPAAAPAASQGGGYGTS